MTLYFKRVNTQKSVFCMFPVMSVVFFSSLTRNLMLIVFKQFVTSVIVVGILAEALTLKHTSLLFVSVYKYYVFMNPSTCVTDLHICIEA